MTRENSRTARVGPCRRPARRALAIFIVLAPLVAFARPRVVLIPFAAKSGASADRTDRFNRVLAAESARVGLSVTSAEPSGRALSAGVRRAWKLYRSRAFDEARTVLRKALRRARSAPLDASAYARAEVMLAAIALRKGDERSASRALEAVARVVPGFRIRAGRYPPLLERELSLARRRVSRAGRGRLEVSGPPGARLYVDGRRIGVLPGALTELARGAHHLRILGAAGEDFSEWVDVGRRTRIPVMFPPPDRPDPVPEQVVESGLTEALADVLEARCRRAHAQAALVGMVEQGTGGVKILAALYLRAAGGFVRLDPEALPEGSDALPAARTLIAQVLGALRGPARTVSLPAPLDDELVATLAGQPETGVRNPATNVQLQKSTHPVQPERSAAESNAQELPNHRDQPSHTALHGPTDALALRLRPSGYAQGERGAETQEQARAGSFWSRVPTWVWIVGGAGLAAAAGATWYGVSRAHRPVQGEVTATW